jgi:WD40 repeat protein
MTPTGHGGRVWEVAFSSDDRRLATRGDDGTARIWDIDSGKQLILGDHVGSVWDVVFSCDDRWLATASEDGKARICDANTGDIVHILAGHNRQVWGWRSIRTTGSSPRRAATEPPASGTALRAHAC